MLPELKLEGDPTKPCPKCGQQAPYPVVDIGVGEIQCGPAVCDCGWVEPSPEETIKEIMKVEYDVEQE